MKGLKILLFLLAIIIIAVIVLNAISPNDISISETIEIDASQEIVYSHVSSFEEMDKWEPWSKLDPNTVKKTTGTDGTVGAYSSWDSQHKDVGAGEQEFTKLEPNSRVETALRFKRPFESEATAFVQLDAEGDKTKATWNMSTVASFPANIFMKFGEGGLREQLHGGLETLKTISEATAAAPKPEKKFSFEVIERPAKTYVMKRAQMSIDNMSEFFQTNLPAVFTAVGGAGGTPIGAPTGLYFDWNEEEKTTDMAVAAPVAAGIDIEGYEVYTTAAGTAIKVVHMGPYEDSPAAHYAMADYMKANGYTQNGVVIEEYVNDPMDVKPEDIQTDIYYLVEKAEM